MNLQVLSCCAIAITLTSCAVHSPSASLNPASTSQSAGSAQKSEESLTKLSISELEQRVAKGDSLAKAELGARYGKGEGVEQNLDKAIELLREAAATGEAEAEFFLGTAYYSGLGVPLSEAEAVLWFEKAAAKGHAAAQYWLAVLIKEGRGGISPSWSAAVHLLWESAMQGYGDAEFLLGYAYQTGSGVEKNPEAAAYWYRRNLSKAYNNRSHFNLALMINEGEVEWRPGDPEGLKPPSSERH